MNHIDPICPFDSSQYTGVPDTSHSEKSLNIPEIIKELDGLFNKGLETQAGEFLEEKRTEAESLGDWRGELSLLSELMGFHRRDMNKEKGLWAVNKGLEIIKQHNMGRTVSGATIILNAATTLKCFGEAESSIPLFIHVSRVFSDNLTPDDYRFAGLYNNMALSYADIGRYSEAERYYKMAMAVLRRLGGNQNELADTLCNMAELYNRMDIEDERINQCLELAWEYLNSPELKFDGYHAFTLTKCIPTFDYFGYFLWVKELRERVNKIYERT